MAGHGEAEGACGRREKKKIFLGVFCVVFPIAYRQMTPLDWRFSVELGSYRRLGADRRWMRGGKRQSLGSWPDRRPGEWLTNWSMQNDFYISGLSRWGFTWFSWSPTWTLHQGCLGGYFVRPDQIVDKKNLSLQNVSNTWCGLWMLGTRITHYQFPSFPFKLKSGKITLGTKNLGTACDACDKYQVCTLYIDHLYFWIRVILESWNISD